MWTGQIFHNIQFAPPTYVSLWTGQIFHNALTRIIQFAPPTYVSLNPNKRHMMMFIAYIYVYEYDSCLKLFN